MITPSLLSLALISNLAPVFAQTKVKGKAFDRLAIVWLENTDYELAASDPNLAWLAKQGISLTNYYALTHPSQLNYAASLSGDYYGMNHDHFSDISDDIFTLVDLLEDKGISWAGYQEDMPIPGYERQNYLNPRNGALTYKRKHNPAIFVTTAGRWTRNFFTPLLKNTSFMDRTLVLITFDENDSYAKKNHVVAILLGDAIPAHLIGTTDTAYYNHYSGLATAEANWNLHTLGRWDVGANVFGVMAEKTGDTVRKWRGKVKFEDMSFN
ncbi:Phosphoesterase domain-containing protein [Pyrenophora tritici-repentis]|nr:Phosphoesterase domain-containing protein [Pyrenophora tritici-repentis]KAI0578712.1 Phosphoesterase domain-containing protein [Pyrenophora tritici-repentis]KAI0607894.1 Phosphoesterase domain-containing protein [Pyrenophora tritici-repentis]KAI0620215.1 Phosphoesterase domain-containing protein [Pyrenophora tritici-repentis]PZC92053.1 Phosphoesterase domain containing protein [Pyrenophora tritici-repentis]